MMYLLTKCFTAGGFTVRPGISLVDGWVYGWECRSRYDAVPAKQIRLVPVRNAGTEVIELVDLGYCGGWELAKPSAIADRAVARWALVYSQSVPILLKPKYVFPSGRVVYDRPSLQYISRPPSRPVDGRLFLVQPYSAFAMWARYAGTTKREAKSIPKSFWYSVHYWNGKEFLTVPLYEDKLAQKIVSILQNEADCQIDAGGLFERSAKEGYRKLDMIAKAARDKLGNALGTSGCSIWVKEDQLDYVLALCAVTGYLTG